MSTTKRNKGGRPPKPAGARGETFSVRLLPALRAQLEEAAAESDRSLSAEISHRLEASFILDKALARDGAVEDAVSRLVGELSRLDEIDRRLRATEQQLNLLWGDTDPRDVEAEIHDLMEERRKRRVEVK